MQVFRIANTHYARDLSGYGAERYGGRWNRVGTAVLYTSETRSLAALEMLGYAAASLTSDELSLLTLDVPAAFAPEAVSIATLPPQWDKYPFAPYTQDFGTQWALTKRSLVLQVPSVLVPQEYNLLLTPVHPAYGQVQLVDVQPFQYDERLFANLTRPRP